MEHLTVTQAARRLGVSPSLIYGLVSARKLRFCRIGNGRGRIRIPEDAIEEYLARCTFGVCEQQPPRPTPARLRLRHLRQP
jgi:excisionase family DNA binding protein